MIKTTLFPLIVLAVAVSGCGTLRPAKEKYPSAGVRWVIEKGSAPLLVQSETGMTLDVPYVILTPDLKEKVNPTGRLPLILALPGRGVSALSYVQDLQAEAQKRGFVLLSPDYLSMPKLDLVYELIEALAGKYPLRGERVVFIGSSAGALVGHRLINGKPDFWQSAVLAASPPFDSDLLEKQMGDWPRVLFVHGQKDDQFDVQRVRETVNKSKKRGAEISLVIHSQGGHEHRPEWNKEIFDWIEKKKGDRF